MTSASETYEDEYEEYDEFDDEDERGLSGFAVLIMGLVMIGAFVSVVWIAYHQGIKTGQNGFDNGTPYVAADPEPIKIETAEDATVADDREVYDVFDGEDEEPVTVLAEGPEEPVDRAVSDTIGALAAGAEDAGAAVIEETEDRLASLAEDDAEVFDNETVADEPEPTPVTEPTNASVTPVDNRPSVRIASQEDALSGTHVVQIGAFRSDDEAVTQWARVQGKLGDYLANKAYDVERADKGAAGVYHRLRVGPFSSSDAAKQFCVGLKELGQDCLTIGL